MKESYLWIVLAAVAVYFLAKRKPVASAASSPAKTGTAATTTGTAGKAPDSAWTGWNSTADTVLKNTTATTTAAQLAVSGIFSGVRGLFGGASSATGKANAPTTTGSGAGVPTNDLGDFGPTGAGSGYGGLDAWGSPLATPTLSNPDESIYSASLTDTKTSTSSSEDPYAGLWGENQPDYELSP